MTYQVISPEGSVETFRTQPGFQHSPFELQVRISPVAAEETRQNRTDDHRTGSDQF